MASTIVSEKFALLTGNGTAEGVVTITSNKGWLPGCTVWLNANGKSPVQCVVAGQIGTTQIQLRQASGGILNLSAYTVAAASNLSLEQQVVAVKFFRNGATSTAAAAPAPEPAPVFYPTISAATFSNDTLSITGTNFVSGAVAAVDGVNKTTTFVSATGLSVNVTGIAAGSHTVVVTNPDTRVSNTYSFTVTYPLPAPVISSATVTGGTLAVAGSNFVSGCVASVDGTNKSTTFTSATALSVDIAGLSAGSHTLVVTNPDTKTSNSFSFSVAAPAPSPVISGATVSNGILTVTGSDFLSGCTAAVDGASKPTTFASSSSLSVDVTGISAGSHTVVVTNPDAKTSNIYTFTVTYVLPNPVITAATFSNGVLTIDGSDFVSGCVASVDGASKPTTFSDSTLVYADLTGIAEGSHTVFVTNPDTKTSNTYTFTAAYVRPPDAPPELPSGGVVTTSDHWMTVINGPTAGMAGYDLAIDGLGSLYVGGWTKETDTNGNFYVAKVSSSAGITWQRQVGGTGLDYGIALARSAAGDIFLTGRSASNTNQDDILLVKYDSAGTIKWQRFLSGTGADEASDVVVDISGNSYVVSTAGNVGFVLAKYDTSGTLQWQKKLGSTGSQTGKGIAVDNQENVYAVGTFTGGGAASTNFFVCKYNPSGGILWQTGIGGGGVDNISAIASDASGNLYVVGHTDTLGAGLSDIFVAKLSSSGTLLWQRVLGGTGSDVGTNVSVDGSGGVYVSGYTTGGAMIVAKYTDTGAILWQRTIRNNTDTTNIASKVLADGAGNFYVAGTARAPGTTKAGVFLAKLPDDGSKTGTYSTVLEYSAASLTEQAGTLSTFATSLPSSNASLTASNGSLMDVAATSTNTKVSV